MNNDILNDFLSALEEVNIRTFTLPILQKEIKYNKLDVIDSSINESIPSFLANRVLETMKSSFTSGQVQADLPKPTNQDMKDLLVRATEKLHELLIEPKLGMEHVVKIPAEDRLAWFVHAMAESQQMEKQGGGVRDAEEVANFPDKAGNKRSTKRATNS